MTDQKTKIDGKFYPLQNEEWLKACQELKPSELKLLYHLRTLDPFGDRNVELGVTALALLLGMSKSTVSEGLKALSQKGWIDLELIKVKVRLKTVRSSEHCSPQRTRFAPANPSSPQRTPVRSSEQSPPETPTQQGSQLSKTYSDFKDSLSDSEREKFFNFVREQIKNLPKPVNDLEAWLASPNKTGQNRWFVYYQNFLPANSPKSRPPQKRRLREQIEQRRAEVQRLKQQRGET